MRKEKRTATGGGIGRGPGSAPRAPRSRPELADCTGACGAVNRGQLDAVAAAAATGISIESPGCSGDGRVLPERRREPAWIAEQQLTVADPVQGFSGGHGLDTEAETAEHRPVR